MIHREQLSQAWRPDSETAALSRWLQDIASLTRECRECRQELAAHWQLCISCDIRLEMHCPGCNSPLPPAGAYACPGCGLAMPRLEI